MAALVKCHNCNTQYAATVGGCPACGADYAPTPEEQVRVAFDDAVQLLKQGMHSKQVEQLVTSQHSLTEQQVASVMSAAVRQERESSKKHGQYVATSGCLLLLAALVVLIVTGGVVIATGCLIVGGPMFIAGAIQSWTGWRVVGDDTD